MTKLSLLGTASALALSFALAQGASATEPRLLVDDNQTNLLSDGNANDGSTIDEFLHLDADNRVNATQDNDTATNNSFNKSLSVDNRATSDNDTATNNSFNKSYSSSTDNRVSATSDNDSATNNSFNKTASNSFNKAYTSNTDNSVKAWSDDNKPRRTASTPAPSRTSAPASPSARTSG